MTLGLILWLDIQDAHRRLQPVPEVPEPATLNFGTDLREMENADGVFPLERYAIYGETQWLPLLLQFSNPEFLEHDKRTCIALLGSMPDDASCPVDYSFWLDPRQGRVLGIQALVLSGVTSSCRDYVECRLPGMARAELDVPQSELARYPSGLRITDKVLHATRRPTVEDESREISDITKLLSVADHADFLLMPAAQRLQSFLRQEQTQRLDVLRHREQL